MVKGLLTLLLAANTKGFDAALGRSGAKLKGFRRNVALATKALSYFGGAFAIIAVLKNITGMIVKFDKSMVGLGAILGKTRNEIKLLEEQAIELGATTIFTANEIGNLQTTLARFGFNQTEIEASTQAILDLAAASGVDLATASDTAAATLRAFGLDAAQMGRVADVMTSAFTNSALTVETFGESMKFAAPLAAAAGVSIEETAAMLGILADNGLRGSIAGTSLRRIFTNLAVSGKSITQIFKEAGSNTEFLADALGFADDQVGKYALSAFIVLAENANAIEEQTELYQKLGIAHEIAGKQLESLANHAKILKSRWERFIISIENGEGAIALVFKDAMDSAGLFLEVLSTVGELLLTGNANPIISDEAVQVAVRLRKQTDIIADDLREAETSSAKMLKGMQDAGKIYTSTDADIFGLQTIIDKDLSLLAAGGIADPLILARIEKYVKLQDKLKDQKGTELDLIKDEQEELRMLYLGYKKVSVVKLNDLGVYAKSHNWVKAISKEEKESDKEADKAQKEKERAFARQEKLWDEQFNQMQEAKGFYKEVNIELNTMSNRLEQITRWQFDPEKHFAGLATSGGASEPATDSFNINSGSDPELDALESKMRMYQDYSNIVAQALSRNAGSWDEYKDNLGGALIDMTGNFAMYIANRWTQVQAEIAMEQYKANILGIGNAVATGSSFGAFGFLAIPALVGVALGIISSAMNSGKKNVGALPMAGGGVVYDTTYAMVGEYGSSRSNPEVVAPLNKLKDILGDTGGTRVYGEFKLKNNVLVAAIQRELKRQKQYGGT